MLENQFQHHWYIMSHIRIATGMDTFAYSNLLKVSGIAGINCPIATPAIMHAATHNVKYFSKNPIPCFPVLFLYYSSCPPPIYLILICFSYMIIFNYIHIIC